MAIGKNVNYLRKLHNYTQEKLADKLGVTRQTVSRWENEEMVPNLETLIRISNILECPLDFLVKFEMYPQNQFEDIRIVKVASFKYIYYQMITPHPESDLKLYFKNWQQENNVREIIKQPKYIGWYMNVFLPKYDKKINLYGYTLACIIPKNITFDFPNVFYGINPESYYIVLTVENPSDDIYCKVYEVYQKFASFIQINKFQISADENVINKFHHFYTKENKSYLDIYLCIQEVNTNYEYVFFNYDY